MISTACSTEVARATVCARGDVSEAGIQSVHRNVLLPQPSIPMPGRCVPTNWSGRLRTSRSCEVWAWSPATREEAWRFSMRISISMAPRWPIDSGSRFCKAIWYLLIAFCQLCDRGSSDSSETSIGSFLIALMMVAFERAACSRTRSIMVSQAAPARHRAPRGVPSPPGSAGTRRSRADCTLVRSSRACCRPRRR